MRMVDLIEKKRDGGVLTDDEIRFIIKGFTDGSIPDYQMSAFAMTVFYKGMTDHETAVLTDAMMRSGDTVDLSRFGDKSVDKHSTGGVGDKTTLIVAPIVSRRSAARWPRCPAAASATRAARSTSSNPSPATRPRFRRTPSCSRSRMSAWPSSASPAI